MWLFFMDIYIYSDESGTFDYLNNDYFVFGGLICFNKTQNDSLTRKYSKAEKTIKISGKYNNQELKASKIKNHEKGKLLRSLNKVFKFCVLIKQKELDKRIFDNKKHKQRYLDYAYKIVLKKCFSLLFAKKLLVSDDIERIIVNVDEHSTATDGKYELRENLLSEFKYGTWNFEKNLFFQPIIPNLKDIQVMFCDSSKKPLIRAADIISNNCFYKARQNNGNLEKKKNLFIYVLPDNTTLSEGIEYFDNL